MLAVKYYNLWHSNSAAIYCINITVEFTSNAKREQSWVGKPHDYPRCFKAAFSVFAKLYVLVFLETIFVGQKYTNRPFFV